MTKKKSSKRKSSATGRFGKIPKYLRSKYTITFVVFAVYITCFDHYSLMSQHQLTQTLHDLEREKTQYVQTIEEAKRLQETIEADEERFARERYYMKRVDEDVYIVE